MTQSLHMGLCVHICTCKCAAGSPTTATTAPREHFGTELALWAGRGAHKTQKTRNRALSAGQSHHMGLYAHIYTSKCAAGSPTPAAAAAREHFCTELALFCGLWAHRTQKTRSRALSAGKSHRVGLYAHICTSKCAAGSPATAAAAAREHYGCARRRGHVAAALTRQKPTKVRASEPHLVSGRDCPPARSCLPPRTMWLQQCTAKKVEYREAC